jgi:2'-5' RNA ligase
MTDPFEIKFAGNANQSRGRGDHRSGFQGIQVTPDLKALHMSLYDSLSPVSTLAYGPEGESYHPHLTVYADPAPGLGDLANEQASKLDLGAGFTATSMCLMGHVGTPYRGEWKLIKDFDFRSQPTPLE